MIGAMVGAWLEAAGVQCAQLSRGREIRIVSRAAFPIATGKHIGDCDLMPSTSASCTPALEADEVRTRQAYREGLGVRSKWYRVCCLFK